MSTQNNGTYRKVQVVKKVTDPKSALEVKEVPKIEPSTLQDGQVLIRILHAGINATDVNSFLGSYSAPGTEVPFDAGLEALGVIEALGKSTEEKPIPGYLQQGVAVLTTGMGCFAEYRVVDDAKRLIPIILPKDSPIKPTDSKFLTIPISAMTAFVCLGEQARIKEGSDVLFVSAAAGGLGQFVVQLAKKVFKAKTVIGTVGTDTKADFVKRLGCDIVINYKTQNLDEELKKAAPNGIDVCFETIGGETFEICLNHLAKFGRMLVVGSIDGYKDQKAFQRDSNARPLQGILMSKSASISGFMLPDYVHVFGNYVPKLIQQIASGELEAHLDITKTFEGVEQIANAVEHLHSGASFGKVIVTIQNP